MYRKSGESRWATREIAALDFLLGIPLEAEREIVMTGLEENKKKWKEMEKTAARGTNRTLDRGFVEKGGWWDTMDSKLEDERNKQRKQLELETGVLERPDDMDTSSPVTASASASASVSPTRSSSSNRNNESAPITNFIPGRRLDGHEATRINIPREAAETELKTTFRTVARRAAEKEWERRTCHKTGILDGRIFFSQASSYPISVFSVTKYDPKNEEEKQRKQKLEQLGGGGSEFVLPSRDWRGISYRMLFLRKERKNKSFNQMLVDKQKRAMKRHQRHSKIKINQDGYSGDQDLSSSEDGVKSSRKKNQNVIKTHHADSEDEYSFGNDLKLALDMEESVDEHVPAGSDSDVSSSSSEESNMYEPGFLDDPNIKKGKHRTEMVGDKVTGCIVSSIIHYVRPADLKADLNKQFRQRFDQWEPPKSRRKYIGARVVDGTYKLVEDVSENTTQKPPFHEDESTDDRTSSEEIRRRKGSIVAEYENIRMPPSLTLSKIRSVKQSALLACIRAKLEVSTWALACVYFERLALDCRVDKSNRRLTFAACLLIAIKINESNVKIVHEESEKESKKGVLKSLIKPRKDNDFFASLFVFFTHEWELTLKQVFAAEWGVFAALEFRLHAKPNEVAFHFKRFMKAKESSPLDYLGQEMYDQWQDALSNEALRLEERAERKEKRRRHKEKKILKLQRELQEKESNEFSSQRRLSAQMNNTLEGYTSNGDAVSQSATSKNASDISPKIITKRKSIFSRMQMGLKRNSVETFHPEKIGKDVELNVQIPGMHRSISSPNLSRVETDTLLEDKWNSVHEVRGNKQKSVQFSV